VVVLVGLTYPEAFPVTHVVIRKVIARSVSARARIAVHRRAMGEFLNSERAKALLRQQGLLVTGDPLPPA
jgi:3-methyladenine DNA glycosylase/8-oxoguanine DNA glycosylase